VSEVNPKPTTAATTEKTSVVNFHSIKNSGLWDTNLRRWNDDAYVYCGRRNVFYNFPESIWHNPYTRPDAIEKFRYYLRHNIPLLNRIDELRGKTLVCWCKPKACHCDVLLEFLGIPLEVEERQAVEVSDQPMQPRLF